MLKKILDVVLATVIVTVAFAIFCLPSIGLTYLGAWLISFVVDINFDSWITHTVILVLSAVWSLITLNTETGDDMLKTLMMKR
ncbi:hypothetical protein SAMN04488070_2025 [Pseudidiomarina maritima]|jgi:hypothetical protein|uniref:Uncharacterized protein n=1 Tax=Pseudidiomarina maritima TaxID=519453 RepID=A0A1I6HQ16_9GAMM|nr:hypothetical protein [Pseudidiomarina maritima]SFR56546.1 hypothetical protein SAMN04488070_2025 [Pseudidiomarina maritima]